MSRYNTDRLLPGPDNIQKYDPFSHADRIGYISYPWSCREYISMMTPVKKKIGKPKKIKKIALS